MQRGIARVFVLGSLAPGLLVSCASTDKAGAPRQIDTTRLTMSTRTLGAGAAAAFAAEVERSSDGAITIDVQSAAHRDLGRGSDAAILADVVRGDVALGVVSIEALQQVGVHTLDPFAAPGVLTSVDAEVAAAETEVAATMLAGTTSAAVTGIAIVPGPVHHLAAVGEPLTTIDELDGVPFLVTATSSSAIEVVERLGATVVMDDRLDALDVDVRALDAPPQLIGQRQAEDATGFLLGNAALWPQPVVIIANPNTLAHLDTAQRSALIDAGHSAVRTHARSVAEEDAAGLAALCRSSSWRVLTANVSLLAAVDGALDAVTHDLRSNPTSAAALAKLEQIAQSLAPETPLSCPESSDSPTSTTLASDPAGIATALLGTWEADVTQSALDQAGVGPTEENEVGHWEVSFADDGRVLLDGPDHLEQLDAAFVVDGDAITMTIDSGTAQQGRGEIWRFAWSVFRDTLTLTRSPGNGVQAGPTCLVSQPFSRM